MINFYEKKAKTRIPQHDYVFDKPEYYLKLLDVLTPKFAGNWTVALVDPTIKFVEEFIESRKDVPFVEVNIYLAGAKLDQIMLKHTKLLPKNQSTWETYMVLQSEMHNVLSHDASKYLYKACNGDTDAMADIIEKLDTECETGTIQVADVKKLCTVIKKPLYASAVYEAFLLKKRERWALLAKLEGELGTKFSYYALRKQSVKWLEEKVKYLHNEDVKNYNISRVDSAFICYAYTCFINSNSPSELYTVMYDIDNRCEEALERRVYANLQ